MFNREFVKTIMSHDVQFALAACYVAGCLVGLYINKPKDSKPKKLYNKAKDSVDEAFETMKNILK